MSNSYIVKSGDTLGAIAQQNNTTVSKLMELNSSTISNPNQIYIGQNITLPTKKEPINIRKKKVKAIKENTSNVEPENGGTECPKIKITLLKPCSNKPNLGCKKIGLANVKFSSEGSSLGETDEKGEVIFKKSEVENLTFNITSPYYKDTSIQTSKDQEVILEYDRKKVIKEIHSSTGLTSRSSWSTHKCPVHKLTEHWCYHMITIHHAGDGFLDTVQEIEKKHLDNPDFDDLGYHYIIGKDGTIYEGRKIGYSGSHVKANNSYKIGINLIGDYNYMGYFWQLPHDMIVPQAQIDSTIKLINSLKEIFPLKELGGHQDYALSAGATCPGNVLYDRLGEMRIATGLTKPEFIQLQHKPYYEGKNRC